MAILAGKAAATTARALRALPPAGLLLATILLAGPSYATPPGWLGGPAADALATPAVLALGIAGLVWVRRHLAEL